LGQGQVVGGGCDSQGHCSSSVKPGSPTLYEYKPDRQSVGRDFAIGTDKSQHGGYATYVKRDKCHIGNVDYYWSAGIWHHGGYWTLTFDSLGREKWSGPSNQHWAFEHNDVCQPLPTPIPTATSTPVPTQQPGLPTYTPTPRPPAPPAPNATFDISIHSTLDPNSADSNPTNAVYESSGDTISWPAGEVLDFTPRVQISVPQPVYSGYRVQAHVQDWSYVSSLGQRAATAKDAFGRSDCGGGGHLTSGASGPVCTYAYVGGASLTDTRRPTDTDMATQAHVYWAPSAPQSMRPDVYAYALGQLQAVDLTVEVRIVVEVVNVATGTVVASNTQTATGTFEVNLVVPRSVK